MSALLDMFKNMPAPGDLQKTVREIFNPIIRSLQQLVIFQAPNSQVNVFPGGGNTFSTGNLYDTLHTHAWSSGRKVEVYLFDNSVIVSFADTQSGEWGNDLILPGPGVYVYNINASQIRVKSFVQNLASTYQVAVWN